MERRAANKENVILATKSAPSTSQPKPLGGDLTTLSPKNTKSVSKSSPARQLRPLSLNVKPLLEANRITVSDSKALKKTKSMPAITMAPLGQQAWKAYVCDGDMDMSQMLFDRLMESGTTNHLYLAQYILFHLDVGHSRFHENNFFVDKEFVSLPVQRVSTLLNQRMEQIVECMREELFQLGEGQYHSMTADRLSCLRACFHLLCGDKVAAIGDCERTLIGSPSAYSLLFVARVFSSLRTKVHVAQSVFKELVDECPSQPQLVSAVHGAYAVFLEKVNHDYDSAEKHYTIATSLEDGSVSTHCCNFATFLRKKRLDVPAAVDQYEKGIAQQPSDGFIAKEYAVFLTESQPFDGWEKKAEQLFEVVVKAFPNCGDTLRQYALFLQSQGSAQARTMFKAALEADPTTALGWFQAGAHAGVVHKNYDYAVRCFEQGVSLDASRRDCAMELGRFLRSERAHLSRAQVTSLTDMAVRMERSRMTAAKGSAVTAPPPIDLLTKLSEKVIRAENVACSVVRESLLGENYAKQCHTFFRKTKAMALQFQSLGGGRVNPAVMEGIQSFIGMCEKEVKSFLESLVVEAEDVTGLDRKLVDGLPEFIESHVVSVGSSR